MSPEERRARLVLGLQLVAVYYEQGPAMLRAGDSRIARRAFAFHEAMLYALHGEPDPPRPPSELDLFLQNHLRPLEELVAELVDAFVGTEEHLKVVDTAYRKGPTFRGQAWTCIALERCAAALGQTERLAPVEEDPRPPEDPEWRERLAAANALGVRRQRGAGHGVDPHSRRAVARILARWGGKDAIRKLTADERAEAVVGRILRTFGEEAREAVESGDPDPEPPVAKVLKLSKSLPPDQARKGLLARLVDIALNRPPAWLLKELGWGAGARTWPVNRERGYGCVADALNDTGATTSRGEVWEPKDVRNMVESLE